MSGLTKSQAEILQWIYAGKSVGFHKWSVVAALHRRGLIKGWVRVQWGYVCTLTPDGEALANARGQS